MVESQPSKLLVAGSIPVSRSIRLRAREFQARYGEMSRHSAEGAKAARFTPGDVVPRTPSRRRSRGPVAPLRSGGARLLARLGRG